MKHPFFQDNTGKYVIGQPPNFPVYMFVFFAALHLLVPSGRVGTISEFAMRASAFLWAYLEIRYGESTFRRVMGGVVMVVLLISIK